MIEKARKLSSTDYTQESFERVTLALEKALTADRSNQTAIDMAVKELNEAIAALQKKQDPPIKDIPVVESKLPAVNSIYKDKNFVYKVTKNLETAIVRPVQKTRTKVSIPKAVKINGYTLKVTGIQKQYKVKDSKLRQQCNEHRGLRIYGMQKPEKGCHWSKGDLHRSKGLL